MIRARDALETALDFYFDDRREVPGIADLGDATISDPKHLMD